MKKDIEWLKKEIEEYLEYEGVHDARIALESVLGYIDQLDEPETLSQEWIDENKVARIDNVRKMTTSDVVTVEKLKNLLVPKQDEPEKTVIPQKIADFIEKSKGKSHSLAYAINSTEVIKWFSEKHRDEWLYSNERENLFARAWLDGYEVEKEKLYTVDLPHYYELIKPLHTQTYRIKKYSESGFGDYTNTFTEAEIKSIDERYWAFANEVLQ